MEDGLRAPLGRRTHSGAASLWFLRIVPLFLVSLTVIGFEISLTRYFAIASWSEYGYWVISITMTGFAVSGVVLSLFKGYLVKRAEAIMLAIPPLLMIFASAGFYFTTINPFNPLEFQNRDQWLTQLLNIGKYYAALFPFFFFAGLFIGFYFLRFQGEIPKIYAADLTGAGTGAVLILLLMFWIHPFYLLTILLPVLLAASIFQRLPSQRFSPLSFLSLLGILVICETFLVKLNRADFNEYKEIYPPLHVRGSQVVEDIKSPRGYFLVLDDFTERLDTDFSNNFGVLKAALPPLTFGLYNDGKRIASLPKRSDDDLSYLRAALDVFPYELRNAPEVLLIGTRGGFRIREALFLGASSVVAVEPDETLYRLIRFGVSGKTGLAPSVSDDTRVRLLDQSPATILSQIRMKFDLVDIASDYLGQSDTNKFAFTVEAVQGYFQLLKEDGLISIPVSIREFTVYAVKMLETVRQALVGLGVERPADHILIYRSSWNARILVSKKPFDQDAIRRLITFSDQRSFDTSYFPGIDPTKIQVWNDLPLVSVESESILSPSDQPSDALMEESIRLLSDSGSAFLKGHFFNLRPSTYDRPFFYSIIRLAELKKILHKIALIPREELGYLINLAVLVQAGVFAVVILILPLIRWRQQRPETGAILKSVLYFPCLGLGFLFLEILLIEKSSFFLGDRTYAFAVVLAGMLVFSGAGSYTANAYLKEPRKGIAWAGAVISLWIILALIFLDRLLLDLLGLPFVVKCIVVLIILMPLSFALGFPFPLGLYLFRGERSHFLPWAWSLNGAFSVISTPLANLLAVGFGYRVVLMSSLLLYVVAFVTFPAAEGRDRV